MNAKQVIKTAAGVTLAALGGGTVFGLVRGGLAFSGPLKELGIRKIEHAYDPQKRKGEIVFYGASNFRLWKDMEGDFPLFKVQNHGFGGCNDQDLIDYAGRLLYPYAPKIVVFQTGSNDYVAAKGSNEEKIRFCMERKARMFDLFHEKLPQARFVVMSGILLPGRSEYIAMTQKLNRELCALCESRDYMTYVDAEALTYQNGVADPKCFIKDQIHLTDAARIIWANDYIIPALQKLAAEVDDEAKSFLK